MNKNVSLLLGARPLLFLFSLFFPLIIINSQPNVYVRQQPQDQKSYQQAGGFHVLLRHLKVQSLTSGWHSTKQVNVFYSYLKNSFAESWNFIIILILEFICILCSAAPF